MDSFSEILHQILMSEKKYDIKVIAHSMDMKYDKFYSRLIGRVVFKPEEIRKLIGLVPDKRLVGYFLEETDMMPINKLTVPENPKAPEVMDGVLELVLNASNVLREVKTAMNDELIDHIEKKKVLNEIAQVEGSLVLLSHRLSKK